MKNSSLYVMAWTHWVAWPMRLDRPSHKKIFFFPNPNLTPVTSVGTDQFGRISRSNDDGRGTMLGGVARFAGVTAPDGANFGI